MCKIDVITFLNTTSEIVNKLMDSKEADCKFQRVQYKSTVKILVRRTFNLIVNNDWLYVYTH